MLSILYPLITAGLFAVAFITKRRFGILGLALATGSILSDVWVHSAGTVVSTAGISLSPMIFNAISVLIVVAPAGVLLFHIHKYKTLAGRIFGSVMFTILAMAFLLEPLGRLFVFQGFGSEAYNILVSNRLIIIGICLTVAIVDKFLSKSAGSSSKRSKH